MDEKTQKLRAAIAEFMEIPPESVGDFILGFEKVVDGGMEFSSLWTTDLYWRLKGFLNEIDLHVDSVRQQNQWNHEPNRYVMDTKQYAKLLMVTASRASRATPARSHRCDG